MSFLADTGADITTIMPLDLQRFSIGLHQLINPFETYGVGGKAEGFKENAIVTFLEPGFGLRLYNIDILILKPTQYIMQCPSLLGRDIMSKWSVTFDKINNRMAARVLRADVTTKFSRQVTGLTPLPGVAPPLVLP